MTVAELIERLREMPQNATVAVLEEQGLRGDTTMELVDARSVETVTAKWREDSQYSRWVEPGDWGFEQASGEPCTIVAIR